MKKFPLCFLLIIAMSACSTKAVVPEIKVKNDLNILNDIKLDYENAFFDDFSHGIDSSSWYIANQAWGSGNGGVLKENVAYTDDGILLLQGNGKYYAQDDLVGLGDVKDGRYTGGALISKFLTKPGRYEVKMKVLPRLGACTAFWTFAYKFNEGEDNLNHEIDIELPGGNQLGNPTFENILNTNYIKENLNISQDTKLSTIFDKDYYLNDGEFHTFGFDWYTDPEMIVYYIDNKICAISESFVPTLQTRLWLGVWFPVSAGFVGTANFETDTLQVDYVKYIPFLNQPYEEFNPSVNGVALESDYPTLPVSLPISNYVSNGDFEYNKTHQKENYGFEYTKYAYEKQDQDIVSGVLETGGYEDSYGAFVKDGGVIQQSIDSIVPNQNFEFSFDAKGNGTANVYFYGETEMDLLQSEVIEISNSTYEHFKKIIKSPSGTKSINILFDSSKGNELDFDNVSFTKAGE